MTFRQRQDRPATTYLATVLTRLHRETLLRGNGTSSFQMLCDVTSIPRDLQTQLLRTMVGAGYVTAEGEGQVRITPAGTRLAATPLT